MKKTIKTTWTIAALILASCGSSISSDAQKVAELQCEAQDLQKKAMSGDSSLMTDAQELISKANALTQELQRKYASIEDRQEFQSALADAMGNCN